MLTQGTTHYTLSLPSIEVVINQAGFKNIQTYGDYDTSDYNEKSRRLIVVAQ